MCLAWASIVRWNLKEVGGKVSCIHLGRTEMINGVVNTTTLGVPQGENLSSLLSNIMQNELDK